MYFNLFKGEEISWIILGFDASIFFFFLDIVIWEIS